LCGKPSGEDKKYTQYMLCEYKSNPGVCGNFYFEFPKLRKKIAIIDDVVFIKVASDYHTYLKEVAGRDISAGGLSIRKKGDRFFSNWNTFFDGFFAILDRPCFDKDDNKGILCWVVAIINGERWCFYVDDFCICHSVRVK
jgi:hypothetical protein